MVEEMSYGARRRCPTGSLRPACRRSAPISASLLLLLSLPSLLCVAEPGEHVAHGRSGPVHYSNEYASEGERRRWDVGQWVKGVWARVRHTGQGKRREECYVDADAEVLGAGQGQKCSEREAERDVGAGENKRRGVGRGALALLQRLGSVIRRGKGGRHLDAEVSDVSTSTHESFDTDADSSEPVGSVALFDVDGIDMMGNMKGEHDVVEGLNGTPHPRGHDAGGTVPRRGSALYGFEDPDTRRAQKGPEAGSPFARFGDFIQRVLRRRGSAREVSALSTSLEDGVQRQDEHKTAKSLSWQKLSSLFSRRGGSDQPQADAQQQQQQQQRRSRRRDRKSPISLRIGGLVQRFWDIVRRKPELLEDPPVEENEASYTEQIEGVVNKMKEVASQMEMQDLAARAKDVFTDLFSTEAQPPEKQEPESMMDGMRQRVAEAVGQTVDVFGLLGKAYQDRTQDVAGLVDQAKQAIQEAVNTAVGRLLNDEGVKNCLKAVKATTLLVEEECARTRSMGRDESRREVLRRMQVVARDAEFVGNIWTHSFVFRRILAKAHELPVIDGMMTARIVPRMVMAVTAAVVHGWEPLEDPLLALLIVAFATGSLTRQLSGNLLKILGKALFGRAQDDSFMSRRGGEGGGDGAGDDGDDGGPLAGMLPDIWYVSDSTEEMAENLFNLFATIERTNPRATPEEKKKRGYRSIRGSGLRVLLSLIHYLRWHYPEIRTASAVTAFVVVLAVVAYLSLPVLVDKMPADLKLGDARVLLSNMLMANGAMAEAQ